jgi:hypothetical protein
MSNCNRKCNYQDNNNSKQKNRLNIVLLREPEKYKEFTKKYKNKFFTYDESIHEFILLFPKKYNDMKMILEKFANIFYIDVNRRPNKYLHVCTELWVAKNKQIKYDGCDLFFDYKLEDCFSEEKVFENDCLTVFKYNAI